jgi:hypothetical protein
MKTSLAIMLAVAALISGATVSLNPGTTLAQVWCTKRLPTAAESGANRPTSRSVSRDRDASRPLKRRPAGRPEQILTPQR